MKNKNSKKFQSFFIAKLLNVCILTPYFIFMNSWYSDIIITFANTIKSFFFLNDDMLLYFKMRIFTYKISQQKMKTHQNIAGDLICFDFMSDINS